MKFGKRIYLAVGLVAVLALAGAAVTMTSSFASAGGGDEDANEVEAAPGTLDDGADLLPQASITVDEAVAAAQGAVDGALGEVDLEHFDGKLVFNIDVGSKDVKVDAATGAVLAAPEGGD